MVNIAQYFPDNQTSYSYFCIQIESSERTDEDFAYGRISDGVTAEFKSGTWSSAFGEFYSFNPDGKSGILNEEENFEYEKNGSDFTFTLDSSDERKKAKVIFASPEKAFINWEDSSSDVWTFVSSDE